MQQIKDFAEKISKANADARVQWDAIVETLILKVLKNRKDQMAASEEKVKERVEDFIAEDLEMMDGNMGIALTALKDCDPAIIAEAKRRCDKVRQEALVSRRETRLISERRLRAKEFLTLTDMSVVRFVMRTWLDEVADKDKRLLENFSDTQRLITSSFEAILSTLDDSKAELRLFITQNANKQRDAALKEFYEINEEENVKFTESLGKTCLECVVMAGCRIYDNLHDEEDH